MPDLNRNHPAIEAATLALWSAQRTPTSCPYEDVVDQVKDRWRNEVATVLTAAIPHLTADDLRHTPAGNALIREGMALSGKVGYHIQVTPGGRFYNPGIPGDLERANREDALARAAAHNLRESAEGRALMAEAWEEGWRSGYMHMPDVTKAHWPTRPEPNPYREDQQ